MIKMTKMIKMTTYSHTFETTFSLKNEHSDANKTTPDQLIKALQKHVDYLQRNPDEAVEAVDNIFHTYEVVPVPESERFIVERCPFHDLAGYRRWAHVKKYLETNPHSAYRLVSVSLIKGDARLVWEDRDEH